MTLPSSKVTEKDWYIYQSEFGRPIVMGYFEVTIANGYRTSYITKFANYLMRLKFSMDMFFVFHEETINHEV